jgi:hypothetical protein
MAFLIKKQSFKKMTVILRVTGKLLLKSKDTCLNEKMMFNVYIAFK